MSEPDDRQPSVPEQPLDSGHPTVRREGGTFLSLVFRSPLSLVILGALTFMGALLLLEGIGRQNEAFWRFRGTWLWHVLFAFQPVLYVASVAVVSRDFKSGNHSVWPRTYGERWAVVLCTVLAGIVSMLPAVFMFIARSSLHPANLDAITQMPGAAMKLALLGFLGTSVSMLHCSGLFGAHVQLIRWLPEYKRQGETPECLNLEEDVLRYLRLRSQLKRFLGFIAAIIGTAILHAGAFNNLLSEFSPSRPESASSSFVMAYGLYFTGLLAGGYLPVHHTLAAVGEVLASRLVQNSIGARATWKEWSGEQQAVRTYLGLQGSVFQELQQGIAVLVPLLASISSLLLGAGG